MKNFKNIMKFGLFVSLGFIAVSLYANPAPSKLPSMSYKDVNSEDKNIRISLISINSKFSGCTAASDFGGNIAALSYYANGDSDISVIGTKKRPSGLNHEIVTYKVIITDQVEATIDNGLVTIPLHKFDVSGAVSHGITIDGVGINGQQFTYIFNAAKRCVGDNTHS